MSKIYSIYLNLLTYFFLTFLVLSIKFFIISNALFAKSYFNYADYAMITLFKKMSNPVKHSEKKVHFYTTDSKMDFSKVDKLHPNEKLRYSHPIKHDLVEIQQEMYYYNVNCTTKEKVKIKDGNVVDLHEIGISENGKSSNIVLEDMRFFKVEKKEDAEAIAKYVCNNYKNCNSTVDQHEAAMKSQHLVRSKLKKSGFNDDEINFPHTGHETNNEFSERLRSIYDDKFID